MKRTYKIILIVVAIALVATLLTVFFIRGKGDADTPINETTIAIESTSPKETEATQIGGSSVPTYEETTSQNTPSITPEVTVPEDTFLYEEESTGETIPEITIPSYSHPDGGIVLPDDNLEDY